MNWLDFVIVGVIVTVVVVEYKRKLIQGAAAGVCAWVGLNFALQNFQTMAPKMGAVLSFLGNPSTAFAALFWGIFLAGVLGGAFVYLTTRMEPAGDAMEPTLGAIFGLVSGVQIIRFFLVYQVLFNPTSNFQKVAQASATYQFIYELPFLGDMAKSTEQLRDPTKIKGSGGF